MVRCLRTDPPSVGWIRRSFYLMERIPMSGRMSDPLNLTPTLRFFKCEDPNDPTGSGKVCQKYEWNSGDVVYGNEERFKQSGIPDGESLFSLNTCAPFWVLCVCPYHHI